MKKNSKRILRGLLCGLLFLAIIYQYAMNVVILNYLDRNILDEIYVDAEAGGLLFDNVKEGVPITYRLAFYHFDYCSMEFDEKYLRDEYKGISIFYDGEHKKNMLEIYGSIWMRNENRLYIEAIYNYKTKILKWQPLEMSIRGADGKFVEVREEEQIREYLEEAGITEEDIKRHQDYILKETVLKKWAKANFRFPFHLMRGINVVDNSWDFEE